MKAFKTPFDRRATFLIHQNQETRTKKKKINFTHLDKIIVDLYIFHSGIKRKWQRCKEAKKPNATNYPNGALQPAHLVQIERIANGEVALRREGDNCQHGDVRRPAGHQKETFSLRKGCQNIYDNSKHKPRLMLCKIIYLARL